MNLTAVSLFAGVGGFDLALERSGVDVVAAVEIDDAARGVLADRFPNTTLFSDVREVTGDALRSAGFVPERGILTGGFPCQDLSLAGRRGGMGEGTRSGLFWEIDRLVADLRPAWVVLENVPGLLSAVCPDPDSPSVDLDDLPFTPDAEDLPWGDELPDDELILADEHAGTVQGRGACEGGCLPAHGGAMGLVLGSLADRGYGFAYRVLDAQYTGVPQRRRRVFIVGRAGGDARGPVEVLLEPESSAGDLAAGEAARTGVASTVGRRVGGSRTTDGHGANIVSALTGSSVGGNGGPDDNTAQAGHLVSAAVSPPVTSKWAKGTGGPAGDEAQNLIAFDAAQITSATNRSNPKPGDPAPPLAATGSPHVAETLRSHPRPGSNSNGALVAPISIAVAGDFSTGEDIAQTVRSAHGQPGTVAVPGADLTAAVRRLSPLECERLQGFPDRWTFTSNGKPQADAARYRQCGNAVAVPVIEWIAGRVVAVHSRRAAA